MAFGAGPSMGGSPRVGGSAMGNKARPSLRVAFVSLQNRKFRLLWFSMLGSFVGMQMQMIARGWLAFELTGSFAMVGVVSIAWGIPMMLFSLPGGAIADRIERRDLVFLSQLATGLLALATGFLITIGQMTIPILFGLGLLQGTIFAFNMPARQALIAEIVPPNELMNAIALNNAGMNATRIFGPAVAGVLIGLWGVDSAYYAQAFMYLSTLVFVAALPQTKSHLLDANKRGSMPVEIGVGLRYIAGHRTLLILMLMAFVPTMLGMPYMMLLPGLAMKELSLPADGYGFLITVSGIGALVGSLIVAALTTFSRKALLQSVTGVGFGAGLFALGIGTVTFGYPGALVAITVLGLFSSMYMTLNHTMIMMETKPEFYGRIMSMYMLTFSVFPFMSYPLGIVADMISATTTFSILGLSITIFIVLMFLLNPRFVFKRSSDMPAGVPDSTRPNSTNITPDVERETQVDRAESTGNNLSARQMPDSAQLELHTKNAATNGAHDTQTAERVRTQSVNAIGKSMASISSSRVTNSRSTTVTARRDYMGNDSNPPIADYMQSSDARSFLERDIETPQSIDRPPDRTTAYGLASEEQDLAMQALKMYGLEDEPPAETSTDNGESNESSPEKHENEHEPTDTTSDYDSPEQEHEPPDATSNHDSNQPEIGSESLFPRIDRATQDEHGSGLGNRVPAERVELPGPPPPRSAGLMERLMIATATASVIAGAISSVLRRQNDSR